MKVYVHVGLSKTGSSALQTYLSQAIKLKTDSGEQLLYCAIQKDGKVLYGEDSRLR